MLPRVVARNLNGSFRPRVLQLLALVAYCLPRFCNPALGLVLGLTPVHSLNLLSFLE